MLNSSTPYELAIKMEPNHWTTAKAKTTRQKYKKQTEMVQICQKMNTE